ncbi:MAG: hypothetical protein JNG89_10710 [Planctomycetaceae bacterium]|nr:hypothetical protein [Planctomycetaceae bacterium]
MRTLSSLWNDEAGFIVSAELVLLGSLLVVGLLAGMSCMQEAVIGEYQDVAGAISSLDQSYSYNGMHGCFQPACCGFGSWTAGSAYPASNAAAPVIFDYTLQPVPVASLLTPVAPPAFVTPPVPAICPPVPVQTPAPMIPAEPSRPAPACRPHQAAGCAPAGCPCVDTHRSIPANNYRDYGYADPRPLMGPLVW